MKTLLFLIFFTSLCFSQVKPKFVEKLPDSVEIIETRWATDSIEYAGDSQCLHAWVNGDVFWHKERELAGVDSLRLSKLPPRHIQPRICSNCLRKEYLVEHTTKQRVESEYARLRRQMLKKR